MKTVFDDRKMTFEDKKHTLIVEKEGFALISSDGKTSINLKFSDIGSILPIGYCNSNKSYNLIFRNSDGQNICEITTDETGGNTGHNIAETKTILVAFAASKLTKDFPNNLYNLDTPIAHSLKEKEIRISQGKILGKKHTIDINSIRRVKCVTNGTISNLAIYIKDKGGFFDMPDMTIPVNEVTLPLLEAIATKNTGRGIDFSRGDGFQQKTSEFMIIRYMDPGFFIDEDGLIKEEWQQTAYERVHKYGYFVDTFTEL